MMCAGYYTDKLAGPRLEMAYAIAPPRVRRYLEAEIDHVLQRIAPGDEVLELGCGYGRVLAPLARKAKRVVGIDTSFESLAYGRAKLSSVPNCHLVQTDAVRLGLRRASFDRVVCIQNGISAFHVDMLELLRESVRVTRAGGSVLVASYSDSFWEDRLEWFVRQGEAGLVGEVDFQRTGGGVIVCRDGFVAGTIGARQFSELAEKLGVQSSVGEVDGSSVFCEISVGEGSADARAGG